MDIGLVSAFWVVSALLCITPGADWAYLIAASLKNRSPVPAIVGMLSGHLIVILIVAAGVGVLVTGRPWLLNLFTFGGSAYLTWLGISLLRNPPIVVKARTNSGESLPRQMAKGCGISALNPKVFLLILVILPQFTSSEASTPIAAQMLINGLLHLINTAIVYTAVGYTARTLLRTRPGSARIVSYVSGSMMIIIALGIVVERIVEKL